MRVFILLASLLAASTVRAGALETAPTTIELSRAGRSGVLYIANRADHPVTFQVEAFDWIQAGGEEALAQSTVLQVSPPMAELAPGEKQTVRLRAVGGRPAGEQAFRLLVSELPSAADTQGGQVRVLLQLSLPVFAGAGQDAKPALAWRFWREGDDLILTAVNTGGARAKLSGLKVAAGGQTRAVPGGELTYVLAGATRRWRVPAAGLPPGAPVSVLTGTGEVAGGPGLASAGRD